MKVYIAYVHPEMEFDEIGRLLKVCRSEFGAQIEMVKEVVRHMDFIWNEYPDLEEVIKNFPEVADFENVKERYAKHQYKDDEDELIKEFEKDVIKMIITNSEYMDKYIHTRCSVREEKVKDFS